MPRGCAARSSDLRQRAADAIRRIGEPFPQAAELEAARARRDSIEQAIRAAAAPEGDSDAQPSSTDDLADAVMAGMHDGPEVAFMPAMVPSSLAADAGEFPADSELAASDTAGSQSRDTWASDAVQAGREHSEGHENQLAPTHLVACEDRP